MIPGQHHLCLRSACMRLRSLASGSWRAVGTGTLTWHRLQHDIAHYGTAHQSVVGNSYVLFTSVIYSTYCAVLYIFTVHYILYCILYIYHISHIFLHILTALFWIGFQEYATILFNTWNQKNFKSKCEHCASNHNIEKIKARQTWSQDSLTSVLEVPACDAEAWLLGPGWPQE